MAPVCAVVVAGGSGQRVGKALPARAQRAAGGVCFGGDCHRYAAQAVAVGTVHP